MHIYLYLDNSFMTSYDDWVPSLQRKISSSFFKREVMRLPNTVGKQFLFILGDLALGMKLHTLE